MVLHNELNLLRMICLLPPLIPKLLFLDVRLRTKIKETDTHCIYTLNSHLHLKVTVKVLCFPTQEIPSHNDCHDFLSSKYRNINPEILVSEI